MLSNKEIQHTLWQIEKVPESMRDDTKESQNFYDSLSRFLADAAS